MSSLFNNPSIKFKKHYNNNQYIVFLKLADEIEMLLFYHRSMVNIDLLQKSLIPSLIEKSKISPDSTKL